MERPWPGNGNEPLARKGDKIIPYCQGFFPPILRGAAGRRIALEIQRHQNPALPRAPARVHPGFPASLGCHLEGDAHPSSIVGVDLVADNLRQGMPAAAIQEFKAGRAPAPLGKKELSIMEPGKTKGLEGSVKGEFPQLPGPDRRLFGSSFRDRARERE